MKERPILFSAPMVRAILDGRKTQTRRIVKPQPPHGCSEIEEQPDTDPYIGCMVSGHSGVWEDVHSMDYRVRCPYGKPGDRLWVKETWSAAIGWDATRPIDICERSPILYAADLSERFKDAWDECEPRTYGRRRPSIFMRRWMSRITLEIVSVRVERLQDISEADAIREGIKPVSFGLTDKGYEWDQNEDGTTTAKESYRALWESINGPGSWAANPWVWVIEFRRVSA